MPLNFPSDDGDTAEAMLDPQVGDRFTERMCGYFVYIIHVRFDLVVTMEGNVPCAFPKDGKVKRQSRAEFQNRFAYRNVDTNKNIGYWVQLVDRGNDVTGWYKKETL